MSHTSRVEPCHTDAPSHARLSLSPRRHAHSKLARERIQGTGRRQPTHRPQDARRPAWPAHLCSSSRSRRPATRFQVYAAGASSLQADSYSKMVFPTSNSKMLRASQQVVVIVDRYDDACVPAGVTDKLAVFFLAWNRISGAEDESIRNGIHFIAGTADTPDGQASGQWC
ncbi:uncharacterized protein [Miscanthus floridulus]|uniref:uncharacterized protein n=1 Tax=Miscanthus floridulus TaxID=154761 RepID=UPI00345A47AE